MSRIEEEAANVHLGLLPGEEGSLLIGQFLGYLLLAPMVELLGDRGRSGGDEGHLLVACLAQSSG